MEKIQIIKMNDNYKNILNFNLKNVETKYIGKITPKTKILVELGTKFARPNVLLGSHKGKSIFEEQEAISFLANGKNSVPVKIFLLKNGRLFAGNTKWAIAYLKRYGNNVKLKQIPFFIVDNRQDVPVIIDYNGSAYSQKQIQKTITSAQKLNERIQNGWRPIENKYTVGMLKEKIFKQINKEILFE